MKIKTVFTSAMALLAIASMASATQVQLSCTANAREGNGWDTGFMFMQGLEPGALKPFFKFDTSSIPVNAVINSANAYTYLYYSADTYDPTWQYAAREVLSDWNEAGNPGFPTIGSTNLGAPTSVSGPGNWIVTDISASLVQGWVSGLKPNFGVCISKTVSSPMVCVSNRLSGAVPYLVVDYTAVPEPSSIFALAGGMISLCGFALRKRS